MDSTQTWRVECTAQRFVHRAGAGEGSVYEPGGKVRSQGLTRVKSSSVAASPYGSGLLSALVSTMPCVWVGGVVSAPTARHDVVKARNMSAARITRKKPFRVVVMMPPDGECAMLMACRTRHSAVGRAEVAPARGSIQRQARWRQASA